MEIVDKTPQLNNQIYEVGNVIQTDDGPSLICSDIASVSLREKKYFVVSLADGAVSSDVFDSLEDLIQGYGDPSDRLLKATLTIERY